MRFLSVELPVEVVKALGTSIWNMLDKHKLYFLSEKRYSTKVYL